MNIYLPKTIKKMGIYKIYFTHLFFLSILLLLPIMLWSQNISKYPYLFRKNILSKSKTHEIKQVLYGRVYKVQYFYLPSQKQYLIFSNVQEPEKFQHSSITKSKEYTFEYVLLDETGNEIRRFITNHLISTRSGLFHDPKGYSDWLFTGDTTFKKYDFILNEDLQINANAFLSTLQEEYQRSDFMEYSNMRHCGGAVEAGVIFRRGEKIGILLSSLSRSYLHNKFIEDERTNLFQAEYYYSESYPASPPGIEMVRLETDNTYPFRFFRSPLSKPFKIKRYFETYNSGWNGLAKIHGIPIYVPGERAGITCIKARIKGEVFRFRINEVQKYFLFYNLGLRTFELPDQYKNNQSLTFMENVQDSGNDRMAGGSFVIKKADENSCKNDLPEGISEERFQQLPLSLQEALLFPDKTVNLQIDETLNTWIPEILLLKNLRSLSISLKTKDLLDDITKLEHLEELYLMNGELKKLPDNLSHFKKLKRLDISSNKFSEFPKVILDLKNLEYLNIGFNEHIRELPSDINRLDNLNHMEICSTNIISLPESMISMNQLYIWTCDDLKSKVPERFRHLFEFSKDNE